MLTDIQIGYARAVLAAGEEIGITPLGIQIAFAVVYVESNWVNYANAGDPETLNHPHDSISSDSLSSGLFQQQPPWWGTAQCRMTPRCAAAQFFTALQRFPYNSGYQTPGTYAQDVQDSAYPDRYDAVFPEAVALYNQLKGIGNDAVLP